MTRKERRQSERQEVKNSRRENKKQILIDVATSLEDALTQSTARGLYSMQYDSKVYLRIEEDTWKEFDVLPELFTFPKWREIYAEILPLAQGDTYEERDYICKQVILTVFTTNLGNGGELDMRHLLK